MAFNATVFCLHLFEVALLRRYELAYSVVLVEAGKALDRKGTGCRIVGAVEIEGDFGHSLHEEGRTAFIGAPVDDLPGIRHALHAEYLRTLPFASNWLYADLVADAALVFLS